MDQKNAKFREHEMEIKINLDQNSDMMKEIKIHLDNHGLDHPLQIGNHFFQIIEYRRYKPPQDSRKYEMILKQIAKCDSYEISSVNQETKNDVTIQLNNGQVFGVSVNVSNGSPYIETTELAPQNG